MSSEWEEFCESMGVNAGDPDDYDRLENYLLHGGAHPRRLVGRDEDEPVGEHSSPLRFGTFKEASEWSARNGGEPFRRSDDGPGFVPVSSVPKASTGVPQVWDEDAVYHSNPAEFYDKCYEQDRRAFYPRLRQLAPMWAHRVDRGRYSHLLLERGFLPRLSAADLSELHHMLGRKVLRTERWYGIQVKRVLASIEKAERSDYAGLPSWMKIKHEEMKRRFLGGYVPDELKFWRECVKHVQAESSARTEKATG